MATTTHLMTWEAFEQLPDEFVHREIVEGELICLPPPISRHCIIALYMSEALRPLMKRRLGHVYVEAGYKLSHNPPTWIQPDVSFLRMDRVRATDPDGCFLNAPDLAVEVISPSESAADVKRKVEILLAAGSKVVWVCYPKKRLVRVHRAGGVLFDLSGSDKLTLPEILPGWEFPVAKLFEE